MSRAANFRKVASGKRVCSTCCPRRRNAGTISVNRYSARSRPAPRGVQALEERGGCASESPAQLEGGRRARRQPFLDGDCAHHVVHGVEVVVVREELHPQAQAGRGEQDLLARALPPKERRIVLGHRLGQHVRRQPRRSSRSCASRTASGSRSDPASRSRNRPVSALASRIPRPASRRSIQSIGRSARRGSRPARTVISSAVPGSRADASNPLARNTRRVSRSTNSS